MDLELQAAVVATLAADSAIRDLIGHPVRLYQQVKPMPTLPYVTIGGANVNDDSVERLDAAEIFFDLHVWSDSVTKDYVECKRICSALRRSLHNADLILAESRCVLIEHRNTTVFVDADNITRHGVVTFRALTEENLEDGSDTGIDVPAASLGLSV